MLFRYIAILLALGSPASAQPLADLTLNYYARENVNFVDNDIIQAVGGLTFPGPEGGTRWTLGLGVRNEFFEGEFPYDVEFGALRYWNRQSGLRGIGFTFRAAEEEGVSMDLGAFTTYERKYWGARGLAGVQAITGNSPFSDGRHVTAFAVGEASVYPLENVVLRGAVTLDDVDFLGTVAWEVKVPYLPLSLGMEWTGSLGNFRADQFYNDLNYQIRYVHRFGSVRQRDRERPIRAMYRPINPL